MQAEVLYSTYMFFRLTRSRLVSQMVKFEVTYSVSLRPPSQQLVRNKEGREENSSFPAIVCGNRNQLYPSQIAKVGYLLWNHHKHHFPNKQPFRALFKIVFPNQMEKTLESRRSALL